MFDKHGNSRHKNETEVSLTLEGQDPIDVKMFLLVDERITDLLNDSRAFIPVVDKNDKVIVIAKKNIISIAEKEQKKRQEKPQPDSDNSQDQQEKTKSKQGKSRKAHEDFSKPSFDPYRVLRVEQTASDDEVRRAYKDRIKAVHPDTIAALDLDEDLSRAAVLSAQKVNFAYNLVMKQRSAEAKQATA